jgi:hypothetical protein
LPGSAIVVEPFFHDLLVLDDCKNAYDYFKKELSKIVKTKL